MRFAVMGAGGLGGCLAARLAADQNDVILIARGPHRDALAAHGLELRAPDGDLEIHPVTLYDTPQACGFCDFVLFCVRLRDTEEAAALIRPLLAADGAVVCLQQGIAGTQRLRELFGDTCVLGASAELVSELESPGAVRQLSPSTRLVIGEFSPGGSWRQECLLSACIGAGIEAHGDDDIERALWRDFAMNAALLAAAGPERLSVDQMLRDEHARASFIEGLNESVAVAARSGVELGANAHNRLLARARAMPAKVKPNTVLDIDRGRPPELEALLGDMVRRGQSVGVPTPVLEDAYSTLRTLV